MQQQLVTARSMFELWQYMVHRATHLCLCTTMSVCCMGLLLKWLTDFCI